MGFGFHLGAHLGATGMPRGLAFPKPVWSANLSDRPGHKVGLSYTSGATRALVAQYNGNLVQPLVNEIPVQGGRRVDHGDGFDYGYGALGIEWFDTDEYGNDLKVGLGPELFDPTVAASVFNSAGSSGEVAGSIFKNNAVGTLPYFPIFRNVSHPGFLADTLYDCRFEFSTDDIVEVRMSDSGSSSRLTRSANGRLFTGVVVSGATLFDFLSDGTSIFETELLSATIREVYPVRCTGVPRLPAITNSYRVSEGLSAGWVAGGSTPPTFSDDTLRGLDACRVTFPAGALNYNDSRANANHPGSGLSYVDGEGVRGRCRVRISRTLGQYESISIYLTGSHGMSATTISASNQQEFLGESGGYAHSISYGTPGTGTVRWYVFTSGLLSSPLSVTITEFSGEIVSGANDPEDTIELPYVPTGTTAVTTQAEGPSVDLGAIGYDQAGGVLLVEFTPFLDSTALSFNQITVALEGVGSDIGYLYNPSGNKGLFVRDGGVVQASGGLGSWSAGVAEICAIQTEIDKFNLFCNGVIDASDDSGSVPAFTVLKLGTGKFAGAFSAIYYYPPGAIDDAAGIKITTNPPAIPLLPTPVPPVAPPVVAPTLTTNGSMGTVNGVGDTVVITQPVFTGSPSVVHKILDSDLNVLYSGAAVNTFVVPSAAHGKAIHSTWTASNTAGTAPLVTSNTRGIPLGAEQWPEPTFAQLGSLSISNAAWVVAGGVATGQPGPFGNLNGGSSTPGQVIRYTIVIDSISQGSVIWAWDGTGGGGNQELASSAGTFTADKTVSASAGRYLYSNNGNAVVSAYSARQVLAAPADAAAPGGQGGGTASAERVALLAKFDALVALRGSSWISDNNGSPCANPNNASLMTSTDGYTRFPAFDGLRHAFISTQDQSYVTHMWSMATEYIDDGLDVNSDTWLDWWNCGAEKYDHDHYEWRAASGIGQLLCLLIDNPSIALSTTANKLKLANFLRDHVWLKWQPNNFGTGNTNTNCSYFSSRLMMAVIALDKHFGGTTYSAWINTQGALIAGMVASNTNGTTGAANIWGRTNSTDVGGSTTPGTVDMGHATEVGIALQMALEYGYSFVSQVHLDALAKALTRVMWNGSGFRENVNGSGPVDSTTAKNVQGWIYLVKHDSSYLAAFRTWALNSSTFDGSNVSYEARAATIGALLRLTPTT